jgi:putative transcription factor
MKMEPTMTQVALGKKCNKTPQMVALFERGEVMPDQKTLGLIEQALGIKLRGNDIGAPKGAPKKK